MLLQSRGISSGKRLLATLASKQHVRFDTPLESDFYSFWNSVVNYRSDVRQLIHNNRSSNRSEINDLNLGLNCKEISSKIDRSTPIQVVSLSLHQSVDIFFAAKFKTSFLRVYILDDVLLGLRANYAIGDTVNPSDCIPPSLLVSGQGKIRGEKATHNFYPVGLLDVGILQLPPETLDIIATILFGPGREEIVLNLFNRPFFLVFLDRIEDIKSLNGPVSVETGRVMFVQFEIGH